jgi:hypothetical protein
MASTRPKICPKVTPMKLNRPVHRQSEPYSVQQVIVGKVHHGFRLQSCAIFGWPARTKQAWQPSLYIPWLYYIFQVTIKSSMILPTFIRKILTIQNFQYSRTQELQLSFCYSKLAVQAPWLQFLFPPSILSAAPESLCIPSRIPAHQ